MTTAFRTIEAARGPALSREGATTSLDDALDKIAARQRTRTARSMGRDARAAAVLPEMLQRGVIPDGVTKPISADAVRNGHVPHGMSLAVADDLREHHPDAHVERRAMIENAFDIRRFVPEYVRPLFCEAALEMFADDALLCCVDTGWLGGSRRPSGVRERGEN